MGREHYQYQVPGVYHLFCGGYHIQYRVWCRPETSARVEHLVALPVYQVVWVQNIEINYCTGVVRVQQVEYFWSLGRWQRRTGTRMLEVFRSHECNNSEDRLRAVPSGKSCDHHSSASSFRVTVTHHQPMEACSVPTFSRQWRGGYISIMHCYCVRT